MTAVCRTNGDLVAPYVRAAKVQVRTAVERFREHPDELAVGAAPFVLLTLATARHHLNLFERVLISECAYAGGMLALSQYRAWKLREVT